MNGFGYSPNFSFDVIDNETSESVSFKLLYKDKDGVYKQRNFEDIKNKDDVYFAFDKLTPRKMKKVVTVDAKKVVSSLYKDENDNYFVVGNYEDFSFKGDIPVNYSITYSK